MMKKAVQKFSQSALEAVIYLSFFLLGLRIVKTQPWFWPSRNWWKNQTRDARTSADFRGYYLLYVARYVAEIISVGLEYDRKDKREMMLHHFSTVFLIGISYAYGFTRVGNNHVVVGPGGRAFARGKVVQVRRGCEEDRVE